MSFAFNFGGEEEDGDAGQTQTAPLEPLKPVVELFVAADVDRELISCEPVVFEGHSGEVTLYKKALQNVEYELSKLAPEQSRVAQALASKTDLIPRVYEGGLKTWECALDLTQFILKHFTAPEVSGLRVLELGCGSALPGICLLTMGAHVDFLDYNLEVIEHLTIPNVLLNVPETFTPTPTHCRFFAGDWATFNQTVNPEGQEELKYDIIVTSETIYNLDTQPGLYAAIKGALRHTPSAVAYVAAKTHYFGVGGSTVSFRALVQGDGHMHVGVCAKSAEGVNREILVLTWPQ
eukprot:comp20136_c0_seq1/m.24880 comp20136_c0_seq1/g.24880  ORF comp20136_c0_seq1/g.24880 comp20136_c0_seq1/m.24880 type:complete len:292 (-) comp20136_c0_seq1:17-892(-)